MGDVESSPVEGSDKTIESGSGTSSSDSSGSPGSDNLKRKGTVVQKASKNPNPTTMTTEDKGGGGGTSSSPPPIQQTNSVSKVSNSIQGGHVEFEKEQQELAEALRDLSACLGQGESDGGGSSSVLQDANLEDEEEEESVFEMPDAYKSMNVPPRTIPFRSASFSQVDITSEGKYVRNPRSPITLKPTAFCLLNNSYNANPNNTTNASSTLPRTNKPHSTTNTTATTITSNGTNANDAKPPSPSSSVPLTKNTVHTTTTPFLFDSEPQSGSPRPQESSPSDLVQPQPQSLSDLVQVQEKNISNSDLLFQNDQEISAENVSLESKSTATSVMQESLPRTTRNNHLDKMNEENGGSGGAKKGKVRFEVGDPDYQGFGDEFFQPTEEGQEEGNLKTSNAIPVFELEIEKGDEKSESFNKSDELTNSDELKESTEKQHQARPPPIIREESLMGRSSSSEEGPRGSDPDIVEPPSLDSLPKLKPTRRVGLTNQKLSLLDMEALGGSSISGSGGEEDNSNATGGDKFNLYRQSSGQSDASDDLPLNASVASDPGAQSGGQLSDEGCSSPPTLLNSPPLLLTGINPITTPLAAALALDSSLNSNSKPLLKLKRFPSTMTYSGAVTSTTSNVIVSGGGSSSGIGVTTSSSAPTSSASSFASSPPCSSSYTGPSPGSPTGSIPSTSDISRANSLSSATAGRQLPPRRYYKRPLRGPYGEMLEAEMNKVISSRRAREYDSLEFFRESKSSSPSRSPPNDPLLLVSSGSPKLSNALLMASMDDLNLTKQSKHPNPRCRKISTNLPVSSQSSHYHCSGEEGGILTYHQRTASSPSQLLYTSSDVGTRPQAPHLDASPRGHVLAELLETEKSYVDSLRILVKKYMEPLKCSDFIDTGLVDEIFFQIPAIQWHHERLLDALQRRVTDDTQCVGDVLLDTFRQNSLLECYSLFVNNWKNAKGSLKMAVASKPPLARFLEANARQHKGKLSVDSLLIMPIQRIPRYELLLKELLKHTEPTHDDHSRLMLVLEKIKKFAVHIDCASVDPNDNREIEIEGWTAGLGHLVRQDVVALCTSSNVRKERALFLFADSIVIASIKRKSTRKTSSNQANNTGNLEGCKFKLLMKVPLTDIHILNEEYDQCQSKSCTSGSNSSHSEDLDDLRTIHKMMDLANLLKCPHLSLDETLRDLASGLKHHCDTFADAVEFEIKTAEGSSENGEVLKVLFGSADKRTSWLDSFQDTLGKFIRYGFGKMPQMQFLQALPIRKTRAGLLLSCAAPVSLQNKVSKNVEMSDVWVANSDGYVGQVCILTLHPEPAITSCNGVCNSRITCILSVPPPPSHLPLGLSSSHPHSDSSSDSTHRHHHHHHHHSMGYESEDDSQKSRSVPKVPVEHWSVWLGTEDGALHVYDCSDSVRVKKNRHKVQHKAPLNCIVYFDSRVFVSLGNGDVAVYSRNTHGKGWLVNEPSWVTIGSGINPVTKMFCVASTIWCACGSQIKVYGENGGMLELLQSIQVHGEGGNQMPSGISTLAATDDAVWIAVQGSSIIRCYSTSTYDCEFEADVAPPVASILGGCDDIIRQHKSACLRITALLVAPDKTLWIGTSAGVVLTLRSTGPDERKMASLCHGHTGQVRFLTHCTTRDSCVVISGGDGYEEFRQVNPILNNNNPTLSSVVSSLIGDSSVDLSGREDSTNHLLIWRVPKVGQAFQLP